MAILVTNQSHFKPMSFEEILRPYQIMTEEYNKREAEISALDTKAETMRQYAQQEIDAAKLEGRQPASFATQYMDYANSLDKAAEDLATKGLRGTNRKTIYDLTNQYQTNVAPIETALKTRASKADEQRKALLANPDLRFDTDFSTIGLQELIDNPDLGYTPYNLKDFEKRVALSGTGILSRMNENIVLDDSEQWYNITKGVSQNDLIRWQFGDTDASHYDDVQSIGALNAAREEATKIANTVPENLREEVFNRVFENSVNAMQQTTREKANANFMSDIQKNAESRAQQSYLWNISRSGYKIGEKGKIIADPESPHWTAQDIYPEYVKNTDGTNELDTDGNPKIKWEKRKPTSTIGASSGGSSSSSSSSSGKGSSGRVPAYTKTLHRHFAKRSSNRVNNYEYEGNVSGNKISPIFIGDIIKFNDNSGNTIIEYDTTKDDFIIHDTDLSSDSEIDKQMLNAIKQDIKDIYNREGSLGLYNYNYHLDYTNKDWFIQPLSREMATKESALVNLNLN